MIVQLVIEALALFLAGGMLLGVVYFVVRFERAARRFNRYLGRR